MTAILRITSILLFALSLQASWCRADETNLLVDKNGDGTISVLAFGDSLTFGVGDPAASIETGTVAGYPNRLETLVGVPVNNDGHPGEEIVSDGAARLIDAMQSLNVDVVLLLEGTNDAYQQVASVSVRDAYQRVINVAKILGKEIVLMTLPTPCCEHGALAASTIRYSNEATSLSSVNQISVVDLKKAWETTCIDKGQCELYNLPEGLHPNPTGYDVMAQTVAATLLGIDIFKKDGASKLEQALGLAAGTVLVKPEEAAQ